MSKTLIVPTINAAFEYINSGFAVYDAEFFEGASRTEGDFLVVSEGLESEYAMVVLPTETTKKAMTLTGCRDVAATEYWVWYPVFEQGDPDVGQEDTWIIDFDECLPDYVADSPTDAALHMMHWFQDHEVVQAIDDALYNIGAD